MWTAILAAVSAILAGVVTQLISASANRKQQALQLQAAESEAEKVRHHSAWERRFDVQWQAAARYLTAADAEYYAISRRDYEADEDPYREHMLDQHLEEPTTRFSELDLVLAELEVVSDQEILKGAQNLHKLLERHFYGARIGEGDYLNARHRFLTVTREALSPGLG